MTQNSKHTPGPWSIRDYDGQFIIENTDGQQVCQQGEGIVDLHGANAALIAAAPETAAECDRLKGRLVILDAENELLYQATYGFAADRVKNLEALNAELLEAVETYIYAYGSTPTSVDGIAAYEKARTAIAKAKGNF